MQEARTRPRCNLRTEENVGWVCTPRVYCTESELNARTHGGGREELGHPLGNWVCILQQSDWDKEHAHCSPRTFHEKARSGSKKEKEEKLPDSQIQVRPKTKKARAVKSMYADRWTPPNHEEGEREITGIMNERMSNATGTPDGCVRTSARWGFLLCSLHYVASAASNHATLARNAWRWRVPDMKREQSRLRVVEHRRFIRKTCDASCCRPLSDIDMLAHTRTRTEIWGPEKQG